MKIIFLCGCLEPGRDGVGDYVRRMAAELVEIGHQVSAIAINDRKIDNDLYESSKGDKPPFTILRLSSRNSEAARLIRTQQEIAIIKPDMISLQYVPFSFHDKGLSRNLGDLLKRAGGNCQWHIMFHELWVGVYGSTSLNQKLLGAIQKLIIKRLICTLKPVIVTTSIDIYVKHLPAGAKILPLFGNIPIIEDSFINVDAHELKVVHFGTFSSAANELYEQLKLIKELASKANKDLKLLVLGSGGPYKRASIKVASALLGEENIQDKGHLSVTDISRYFHLAQIGISRADAVMAGKSGSTLAMLEHGLPVILRGNKIAQSFEKDVDLQNSLLYHFDNEIKHIPEKVKIKSYVKEVCLYYTKLLEPYDKITSTKPINK